MARFQVPWLPRNTSYPFNLDASERFMRPGTGTDFFPWPYMVGALQPLWAMQDIMVYQGAFRRTTFGPGTTTLPRNLQNQVQVPGLTKYTFG